MGRIIASCTLAILLLFSIAGAAEWKLYAGNEISKYYYDPGSVKHSAGDIFRVSVKEIADNSLTNVFAEINCTEKQVRVRSITIYDEDMNKSAVSYRYDAPPWDFVHPEPENNALIKAVCKQ